MNNVFITQAKGRAPALDGHPMKRGICLRVYTTPPKKPNSANRKVAKVQLSNKIPVIAYIPGVLVIHWLIHFPGIYNLILK